MKTLYAIAKEMGKSPQSVYKRVNSELNKKLNNELINAIQLDENGKIKPLDEKAEKAVKSLFNFSDQPVVQPDEQRFNNPVDQPNKNNDLIATAFATLQEQLKIKDEQIRAKDEQITALSKLVENTQVLLKAEQEKTNPALLAEAESGSAPAEAKKHNFFSRIFRRRS